LKFIVVAGAPAATLCPIPRVSTKFGGIHIDACRPSIRLPSPRVG